MNQINRLLDGVYKESSTKGLKLTSYQTGQIINGKVLKLFPNGIATLQIGGDRVVAQLEASLEVYRRYWFQVQPSEGKLRLKIVGEEGIKNANNEDSLTQLLNVLSLPITEKQREIIRFFLQNRLPITKENIQQTTELMNPQKHLEEELQAIKHLVEKHLPLSKTSYKAIQTVMGKESLADALQALYNHVKGLQSTDNGEVLERFLQSMLKTKLDVADLMEMQSTSKSKDRIMNMYPSLQSQTNLTDYLRRLFKSIGYSYEYDISQSNNQGQRDNVQTLKPLLMTFLKENPPTPARELAENVLLKITGLQLLAQEVGPVQQMIVQAPILLGEKPIDLTVQWSGRKKGNGQIDPEYCRILIYLDLENIHDTIVDMQVQKRVINITIINETERIKPIAIPYIDSLRKGLAAIDFTLSVIQFKHPSKQIENTENNPFPSYQHSEPYAGVDLRI